MTKGEEEIIYEFGGVEAFCGNKSEFGTRKFKIEARDLEIEIDGKVYEYKDLDYYCFYDKKYFVLKIAEKETDIILWAEEDKYLHQYIYAIDFKNAGEMSTTLTITCEKDCRECKKESSNR